MKNLSWSLPGASECLSGVCESLSGSLGTQRACLGPQNLFGASESLSWASESLSGSSESLFGPLRAHLGLQEPAWYIMSRQKAKGEEVAGVCLGRAEISQHKILVHPPINQPKIETDLWEKRGKIKKKY